MTSVSGPSGITYLAIITRFYLAFKYAAGVAARVQEGTVRRRWRNSNESVDPCSQSFNSRLLYRRSLRDTQNYAPKRNTGAARRLRTIFSMLRRLENLDCVLRCRDEHRITSLYIAAY